MLFVAGVSVLWSASSTHNLQLEFTQIAFACKVNFHVWGVVRFMSCEFSVTTVIYIHSNAHGNQSFSPSCQVSIDKCIISSKTNTEKMTVLRVHTNCPNPKVEAVQTSVQNAALRIQSNFKSTDDVSKVAVHIWRCHMNQSLLVFKDWMRRSSGFIEVRNSSFFNSRLYKKFLSAIVVMKMEQCKFEAEVLNGLVQIDGTTSVLISECSFTAHSVGPYCEEGCVLKVEGSNTPAETYMQDMQQWLHSYFESSVLHVVLHFSSKIRIEETLFRGSAAKLAGGVISCRDASLLITNSTFIATENFQPPPRGAFVYFKGRQNDFKAKNVVVSITDSGLQLPNVSVFSFIITRFFLGVVAFHQVQILCPVGHEGQIVLNNTYDVICTEVCSKETYAIESGVLQLEGELKRQMEPNKLVSRATEINCLQCPVGAVCDRKIKVLPNYWAHKEVSGVIRVLRCPEGYCCSSAESCFNINSCNNNNRRGTLCGECATNFSESFFSTDCVPSSGCYTGAVTALYTLSALAYAVFLTVIPLLKYASSALIQKWRNRFKNWTVKKRMETCSNASQDPGLAETEFPDKTCTRESDENDGTGMKYIQILFYYVQDVSLFHVSLPEDNEPGKSILEQLLKFSPEFLFVYTKFSKLCFTFASAAVPKVFWFSVFGFFVMVFLLVLYLILTCISKIWRSEFKDMCPKSLVMQVFLLTILLSYQQMVKGAFALVQCVHVEGKQVLYIQGNVECYTWWQVCCQVYIFTSIIPAFLVFSHAPLLVQEGKMSVGLFVMSCLFPLPVLICHYICTWCKKAKYRSWKRNVFSNLELTEVSEMLQTVTRKENKPQGTESLPAQETVCITNANTETPGSTEKRHEIKSSSCKHTIVHTLSEHYKHLSVCGIPFTWLGIYKLYRVSLVACFTYIQEPLPRLYSMTVILMIVASLNSYLKPYKDPRANKASTLSFVASMCIAIMSIGKVGLVTFNCSTNCSGKAQLLQLFDLSEKVLLLYLPLAACALWVLYSVVSKCKKERKERK